MMCVASSGSQIPRVLLVLGISRSTVHVGSVGMEGWIVWTDGWLDGPRCVSGVRVVPGSVSEAKLSFVFLRELQGCCTRATLQSCHFSRRVPNFWTSREEERRTQSTTVDEMKIERGQGRPKLNWRKARIREGWVRWRAEEKEKKKTKTFRVFPLEVWTTLQHNLGQFHSSFLD